MESGFKLAEFEFAVVETEFGQVVFGLKIPRPEFAFPKFEGKVPENELTEANFGFTNGFFEPTILRFKEFSCQIELFGFIIPLEIAGIPHRSPKAIATADPTRFLSILIFQK